MTLQTEVKACDEVISTELDGEAVLMHVSRGLYFGLNPVGAVIWDLMKQPVSLQRLCDAVCEQFEVAPEVVERDVVALLEELRKSGLAELAVGDGGQPDGPDGRQD